MVSPNHICPPDIQGRNTHNRAVSVLCITYHGILEPLGQSQVLSYLEKLTAVAEISLISFEKKRDKAKKNLMEAMHCRMKSNGIQWIPLTYHKSPSMLATAFDVTVGSLVAFYVVVMRRKDMIHAFSYVPGLVALLVKSFTNVKFIFDMRGFWVDERTDGGIWKKKGFLFYIAKFFEKRFFMAADNVITLTKASVPILESLFFLREKSIPINIIPTCVDLNLFNIGTDKIEKRFTFGYVGSVGTWYLFDDILRCFKTILDREGSARLLIVNRNEHSLIHEYVSKAGLESSHVEIVAAEYKDVPALIRRMDAAAALVSPCFSKIASAPTKIAEYLASGVPCLGNIGVGDVHEILERNRVGVSLLDFSESSIKTAVDRLFVLLEERQIRNRCRDVASQLFSLESATNEYKDIYLRARGIKSLRSVRSFIP